MVGRLQRRVEGDAHPRRNAACRDLIRRGAGRGRISGMPGGRGSSRNFPSSGRSARMIVPGADHSATSGESQERVIRSCVGSPEPRSTWMKAGFAGMRGPQNFSVSRISPRIMWSPSGMHFGCAEMARSKAKISRVGQELAQVVEGPAAAEPELEDRARLVGDQPRRLVHAARAAPSAG